MEEKKFYPNIEFNKSKRKKFFMLLILLVVTMGLAVGLFVSMGQWMFALMFALILGIMLFLIPSTLKTHPVKPDVAQITVCNKQITAGEKTFTAQEVQSVSVNVMLAPVSKLDSENKEYVAKMIKKYPEEECFGNVDILLKASPTVKKGEVIYTTVDDCLGALTALVAAGVKHYSIVFSLNKITEKAQFSITKEETKKQTLTDISSKDRMKQLL